MILTVNIRALKDKLSAFLRAVQRGDVILVTDRGRVVAELRQPSMPGLGQGPSSDRVRALVRAGVLTIGAQNSPDAYRPPDTRLPTEVIDEALDNTRGDR